MVVAWRVAYLMRLGRTGPDIDASNFFDPDEIRGAYLLTKERRPDWPPTLNEVLRLIARVGGFLGRKGDGDPGVKTIWEGIQEVRVAALTIKALRDEGERLVYKAMALAASSTLSKTAVVAPSSGGPTIKTET